MVVMMLHNKLDPVSPEPNQLLLLLPLLMLIKLGSAGGLVGVLCFNQCQFNV